MSPSAMKHTSWLSGLSATARPLAAASRRTSSLVDPPSGNMARLSWSLVSTASTYDWSLAWSTLRASRGPADSGPADEAGRVSRAW